MVCATSRLSAAPSAPRAGIRPNLLRAWACLLVDCVMCIRRRWRGRPIFPRADLRRTTFACYPCIRGSPALVVLCDTPSGAFQHHHEHKTLSLDCARCVGAVPTAVGTAVSFFSVPGPQHLAARVRGVCTHAHGPALDCVAGSGCSLLRVKPAVHACIEPPNPAGEACPATATWSGHRTSECISVVGLKA